MKSSKIKSKNFIEQLKEKIVTINTEIEGYNKWRGKKVLVRMSQPKFKNIKEIDVPEESIAKGEKFNQLFRNASTISRFSFAYNQSSVLNSIYKNNSFMQPTSRSIIIPSRSLSSKSLNKKQQRLSRNWKKIDEKPLHLDKNRQKALSKKVLKILHKVQQNRNQYLYTHSCVFTSEKI